MGGSGNYPQIPAAFKDADCFPEYGHQLLKSVPNKISAQCTHHVQEMPMHVSQDHLTNPKLHSLSPDHQDQ